tara:strand:+ start:865 stop:3771 length:2907 start_codon:yes stop_codon:yes gene_type:complete
MSLIDLDDYESRKAIFEEEKSRAPKEPLGDVKKEYCVGCFQKSDWEFIHAELMKDGSLEDNIPTDKCECVNDCLQSDVRGIYLLTDTEATELRSNPKVDYVNINACAYPGTYAINPDELTETLTDRYSSNVKNQQKITSTSGGIRENYNSDKLNRCSAQLHRHSAKKNPWVTLGDATSVISNKLPQHGTGSDVDVIVCDEDMWFGHIEFCNPSAITDIKTYDASQGDGIGGNASTEAPSNYVGGNALRNGFSSSSTTGMCDVLDLVLDAPYYLDSAWFEASPSTRLTTRWDGTKVPVESVAKEWWSDASKRSAAYASVGTVTPDSGAIINQATPYVRLYVGDTVNFNMSNVGTEHAFYIKTSNTSGTGNQVSTPAATGQGANGNSTTSWTPNTAGFYYIRCANHSMYGYILVKDNPCTGTGSVSTYDITITAPSTSAWFANGPHRGDYNRDRCNGTHKSYKGGTGSHGTPCASQAYGRQYGWAYNANKWFLNLYGSGGVYFERGFDLQKIFHQTKPTNPTYGNKNPTISSNSWGRRFRTDSESMSSGYYFYRPASIDGTTTGVQYTSWDGDANTDGTGGTAPRFMTNRTPDSVDAVVQYEPISGSTMTAANEMTAAGVIFVCSAGNRNQKMVKSTHADYNNYVGSSSNSSLSSTQFYRSTDGLTYHKTLNRGGFPTAFNNTIVIGALDDDFSSGKERKVNYSGTGDFVDLYSVADDTFAASDNRKSGYPRYDSFYTYNSVTSPRSYDRYFNGTSSACPIAVGLIATKLQYNRTWTSTDIKSWLTSIGQQDTNDFHFGTDSASVNDSGWTDQNSLQGGPAIVPFDTAIDTTNPTLSSSVPSNNATGVAINANIVLNFSEAVDAESGNIVIYKASDDSVVETINVTSGQVTGSGTSQITINPSSDLEDDTVFYVQIAATAFDDAAGNSYAGISDKTSLRFSTADPPIVDGEFSLRFVGGALSFSGNLDIT